MVSRFLFLLVSALLGALAGSHTYRVCKSAALGCDFSSLNAAIQGAIAGSTIEICGPGVVEGPTISINKQLHFVCAADCSSGNGVNNMNHVKPKRKPHPKKKKKSMKSTSSDGLVLEKRGRRSSSSSSRTGGKGHGNGGAGANSKVMLTPELNLIGNNRTMTTVQPNLAQDVVFRFIKGSTGSSVSNCEFLCTARDFSVGIDIGIIGIGVDAIKVENNHFESCYFGVALFESSRWNIENNDFHVSSLQIPFVSATDPATVFASTGVLISSNLLPNVNIGVAPQPTRFNAIRHNHFTVQGPTDSECAAHASPVCATGGAITFLDFDITPREQASISMNDVFQNKIIVTGNVRRALFGIMLAHVGDDGDFDGARCVASVHHNVIEDNYLDGLGFVVAGADSNRFLDNTVRNLGNTTAESIAWNYLQHTSTGFVGSNAFTIQQGIQNCIISNSLHNPASNLDFNIDNTIIDPNDAAIGCWPVKNVLINNVAGDLNQGVDTNLIPDNVVFVGNEFKNAEAFPCSSVTPGHSCAQVLLTPPENFEMPCGVTTDEILHGDTIRSRQRFDRTSDSSSESEL